ncbi:PASTA domain-containing protein [Paractinoplanes toevensis]|uniref:PASTA domain-containing protein n=1 Tax=Paractinoplanes toevensis TaxID=571911 RepID=A0A919W4Q3_9ACTN|nr:PASTA domain-containing protein [Actinoplanes toevensis]GIM91910.1 hypothetical protein Ato02nite_037030 [Actinoplanes toevensis]
MGTVEAVEVPPLFGSLLEDAAAALALLGLGAVLLPDFPPPQPGATVQGSIPAVGQLAIVGQPVTLFWADPVTPVPDPPPPTVPDVAGWDEQSAIDAIHSAGYNVGVSKFYDVHVAEGKVITVSPPGGTLLDPGLWVQITVSLGDGGPVRWVPPPRLKTLPPFPIE